MLFSSLVALKQKMEEMDPKKQKKFEKEERDFRKKFKACDFAYVIATLLQYRLYLSHPVIVRMIFKCRKTCDFLPYPHVL